MPSINVIDPGEGGSHIEENEYRIELLETWSDNLDAWLAGFISGTDVAQTRGLIDPNPGTSRLLPAPTAMASAPTDTVGVADATTTISGSRLYGPGGDTSEVFSFFGCPAPVGIPYPNSVMFAPQNAIAAGTINKAGNHAVEFEWYGADFELYVKGTGGKYTLIVDGQYDTRDGTATPNTGSLYLVKYEFGSTAFRRIRFEFTYDLFFGGIRIGPNDSIWKSSMPRGPKVIVTGDSFAEEFTHWPQMMGWLLGWRDLSIVGKGSTGYINTADGSDAFRDRAQKDIYDQEPDIVIVSGGINDSTRTKAQLLTAAGALFSEIKEELPEATLIVSGAQFVFGAADQDILLPRDGIREAAGVYADLYIEQIGGPYPYSGINGNYTDAGWMTGLGRVGSTTGSGNSDIFRSSDSTHPTQAGHDYRGYRHAQAIAAGMPVLGS